VISVAGHVCETSPAANLIATLVHRYGRTEAHRIVDAFLDSTSNIDITALAADWSFWARPKQYQTGDFVSCLHLTGRGWGKTYGIARWINEEVEAGRVHFIGLAAQDEANSILLQVTGPSGLIATAPAWHRPHWEASSMQLVWPNGARAYVRTPEVPGKIRGFDYDLAWLSELQSWPAATRDEAMSNFRLATRLGAMRMIYDATPKRRHPLLRELLSECERDPARYRVVRGITHENAINLADGYIKELEKKYGGTLKGREELFGEMLEDSESALVRQEWIDKSRRSLPDTIARKIISIDPAITERKGSDNTGIIVAGLGSDGQVLILGDASGKMAPSVWAEKTVAIYVRERCDCAIVERNKGGDMLRTVLKAFCSNRGLEVVLVGESEKPRYAPGVLHVKEVFARGAKEDRAQPAATAYERGRVSHIKGVDLTSLEDTLTTWEPSPSARSPGDLDALAHAVNELLDLTSTEPDPRKGFEGLKAMSEALKSRTPVTAGIADLLYRARGDGGKI
jgi:phage terminase large subunit-like protein